MKSKRYFVNVVGATVVVFFNAMNVYALSSYQEQKIRAAQQRQRDVVERNKETIQNRLQGGICDNHLVDIFYPSTNSNQIVTHDQSSAQQQQIKKQELDNKQKIEQSKRAAENLKRMQDQRMRMMQTSAARRRW